MKILKELLSLVLLGFLTGYILLWAIDLFKKSPKVIPPATINRSHISVDSIAILTDSSIIIFFHNKPLGTKPDTVSLQGFHH